MACGWLEGAYSGGGRKQPRTKTHAVGSGRGRIGWVVIDVMRQLHIQIAAQPHAPVCAMPKLLEYLAISGGDEGARGALECECECECECKCKCGAWMLH